MEQPRRLGRSDPDAFCDAFNFGPNLPSNRSVAELVEEILKHWQGTWQDFSDPDAPHEAAKLNLAIDKAHHLLRWRPVWGFPETVSRTVAWYSADCDGDDLIRLTSEQISDYERAAAALGNAWAKVS